MMRNGDWKTDRSIVNVSNQEEEEDEQQQTGSNRSDVQIEWLVPGGEEMLVDLRFESNWNNQAKISSTIVAHIHRQTFEDLLPSNFKEKTVSMNKDFDSRFKEFSSPDEEFPFDIDDQRENTTDSQMSNEFHPAEKMDRYRSRSVIISLEFPREDLKTIETIKSNPRKIFSTMKQVQQNPRRSLRSISLPRRCRSISPWIRCSSKVVSNVLRWICSCRVRKGFHWNENAEENSFHISVEQGQSKVPTHFNFHRSKLSHLNDRVIHSDVQRRRTKHHTPLNIAMRRIFFKSFGNCLPERWWIRLFSGSLKFFPREIRKRYRMLSLPKIRSWICPSSFSKISQRRRRKRNKRCCCSGQRHRSFPNGGFRRHFADRTLTRTDSRIEFRAIGNTRKTSRRWSNIEFFLTIWKIWSKF